MDTLGFEPMVSRMLSLHHVPGNRYSALSPDLVLGSRNLSVLPHVREFLPHVVARDFVRRWWATRKHRGHRRTIAMAPGASTINW